MLLSLPLVFSSLVLSWWVPSLRLRLVGEAGAFEALMAFVVTCFSHAERVFCFDVDRFMVSRQDGAENRKKSEPSLL